MGFEPNAAERLRWVGDAPGFSDIRSELLALLEAYPMNEVPSAALRREIDFCSDCTITADLDRSGLCARHRARWNREACEALPAGGVASDQLDRIVRGALTERGTGTEFLSAFGRQAEALRQVWDAHRVGVLQLPESVYDSVDRAVHSVPDFLA